MAVGVIAAAAAGKRLSKKGRAKAKDKRAKRQDKRADRKEARAKRLEGRGKAGKAGIVRSKANTKKLKAGETRRKSDELKKKIKEGKTVGGRIKKAGKMVSDKVKEKGGVKEIAKNLASKTPAGKIAKKIKDNKPKRDALKKERQASRERKKDIRKSGPVVANAPGMYDGPGGQETPKLGSMSDGMGQYKKGMPYYKGKISYGHNSGMKMNGYAKAGLAGKGLSMNSQQKLSKHFKK